MTAYLDSSVLVAALVEDEPDHESCLSLLRQKPLVTWTHALAETFATLTGGRLGLRVSPKVAADLIESSLIPRLRLIELNARDIASAIRNADKSGVRGGALYDFLHLLAARKSKAGVLYTLNSRHFIALSQIGDPVVETPA